MTLDELDASWAVVTLQTSPDGISGRRARGMPPGQPVYLAVDGRNRRHLLIQVPDDTPPVTQRETRGLEVGTARFEVGPNPESLYVDLACTDSAQNLTFCAVAQDMLRTLASSHTFPRDAVISALARWRAFWAVKTTGMSREDALGLFGELWFMRRWLAPVTSETVARWQVTVGARHDFQWPAASVEVKTAAGRSGAEPVHSVTGVDQLADPEQGQLFLFSLHVCDDALAANTVHSLVEGLAVELATDSVALTSLNEKLAAREYTPVDRQAPARHLRILAERLYRVEGDFPRITQDTFQPGGLPSGVINVNYSLDLAACRQWLVATTPSDIGALAMRTSP